VLDPITEDEALRPVGIVGGRILSVSTSSGRNASMIEVSAAFACQSTASSVARRAMSGVNPTLHDADPAVGEHSAESVAGDPERRRVADVPVHEQHPAEARVDACLGDQAAAAAVSSPENATVPASLEP